MKYSILTVDTPNKNGRIYPRHVVEKSMEKYKKQFIDEKRALISKKIPESSTFNLMDTVGIVSDMAIEGDTVFANAEFFGDDGMIVETLLKDGHAHLRTSGIGTITKQPNGNYKVEDDWEIIGCFLTDDPA